MKSCNIFTSNVYLLGLSKQDELFDNLANYITHEKVQQSLFKKFPITYRTTSFDQIDVKMKIFDATGIDTSCILQRIRLLDGDGFFVTFNLTDTNSFSKVQSQLDSIRSVKSSAVIIILGLNCEDVENIKVNIEEIIDLCRNEQVPYYQISTKDNININEALDRMGMLLLDKNGGIKETHSGVDSVCRIW